MGMTTSNDTDRTWKVTYSLAENSGTLAECLAEVTLPRTWYEEAGRPDAMFQLEE